MFQFVDKLKSVFSNSYGLPPSGNSDRGGPGDDLYSYLTAFSDRMSRYMDADVMDDYGDEITLGLDIYAEDSCPVDAGNGKRVWITSDDPKLELEGNRVLEAIDIEEYIPSLSRGVTKYGDFLPRLILTSTEGLVGLELTHPAEIDRVGTTTVKEYHDYWLPADLSREARFQSYDVSSIYKSLRHSNRYQVMKPWDYIHFRLLFKQRFRSSHETQYGTSLLEPLRRTWKKLKILRDALIIYRLTRLPRDIFKVPVGKTMSHDEVILRMKEFQKMYRKKQYIDKGSGELNLDDNLFAINTDLFLPIVGDMDVRIERQDSNFNIRDLEDLKTFERLLYSGMKIPPEYMGIEEGGQMFDSDLAQKDIRFAKSTRRVQRAVMTGITNMLRVHFAMRGMNTDPSAFSVNMSPVSRLDEQERLRAYDLSVQTADSLSRLLTELDIPKGVVSHLVLRDVLGVSETDIKMMLGGNAPKLDDKTPHSRKILSSQEVHTHIRRAINEITNGDKEAAKLLKKVEVTKQATIEKTDLLKGSDLPDKNYVPVNEKTVVTVDKGKNGVNRDGQRSDRESRETSD